MPIDYKKYPPNWKEIRERILKRANNKCECCGLENHSEVFSIKINGVTNWIKKLFDDTLGFKTVKVVLTIAHLDHDETNQEVTDERLMAMCQLCHLRYDAKEKYRRSLEKSKKTKMN